MTGEGFDFICDLKEFHSHYQPAESYLSLATQIKAIVDLASEGSLTYDEGSNRPGTVCKMESQVGVLEARLDTTSYRNKRLYVRLFYSEPNEVELILLLGTLLKEDFPAGKAQQDVHAGICQARGDKWVTSRC